MTAKDKLTVVQSTTEDKPLHVSQSAPDQATRCAEARLVYPLYAAAATQFDLSPLPYPADELPPIELTNEVFDRDIKWLDEIDEKLRAFQIRQLHPEILNANEPRLNAFIQRQLRKPDKAQADQDKIDLLLVQYFALCASADLYRGEITLRDVAQVLQPVLMEADFTPLEWCEPLEELLVKLEQCRSLRDLMEDGLLEKGRILKNSAGSMFYDPAALVAFCRFNFLLRRAFIRLLHADLSAVSQAIDKLIANEVRSVDCRRAGFSAAETTTQLRNFCENWRQPFHKDYTENSVRQAFEQMLALRTDLEEALTNLKISAASSPAEGAAAGQECLDAIWQQLKAAPLSSAPSMFYCKTSRYESAPCPRGEGAAFPEALRVGNRRTCGAQSLHGRYWRWRWTSAHIQEKKRDLAESLVLGRAEAFAHFQARVEEAKISKNTEAAVNLEISTKRLRSVIETAEKL